MDDAGGGRRGPRPGYSEGLRDLLARGWGLTGPARDLGGSESLNLLVGAPGQGQYVARVHRRHVSIPRLETVQAARQRLAQEGLPVAEPVLDAAGAAWAHFGANLVEVERYVPASSPMDSLERLHLGLEMLGRIHTALRETPVGAPDCQPAFANYIPWDRLTDLVRLGTARIRQWRPTDEEGRAADLADRLAEELYELEQPWAESITAQPVHGDFWDDNVLFGPDGVALVADFGMMGLRPRTDDLALTLFFTSIDLVDLSQEPAILGQLLAAYGQHLHPRLSEAEHHAVRLAMCRQPLWSIGRWVAELDDPDAARRHLAATIGELEWAARFLARLRGPSW